MPDSREISALTTAESTSASDLFETALPNAMTETGYISRKVTLSTIANFLLSTLQFSSLNTTVKNIIGAINELAQGSGQSLDTLNDVDIDDQTLADGQGIVYDATAQKWKNGTVSGGGGHTYSTTEHVVGTWIDGSPVYEKTVELPSEITISNNSWVSTGITISDVNLVIEAKSVSTNGVFSSVLAYNNSGTINVQTGRNNDTDYCKYLIIRYTKTST